MVLCICYCIQKTPPNSGLKHEQLCGLLPNLGLTGLARQLLFGVGGHLLRFQSDGGQGCSHPKSVLVHMLRVWAGRPK